MQRTISAAALGLAVLGPAALVLGAALPAAAERPATIAGRVYACTNGAPVAHAAVRLRGLDDGLTIALTADGTGHFVRVGLAPGRYLIEASAPLPAGDRHWVAPTASRLARVETDDVLELRIGTDPPGRFYGPGPVRWPDAAPTGPHPACDDPLVPLAPAMSDRYIIH